MKKSTSLISLLKDDPIISKRLKQGIKEVKDTKKKILDFASSYNEKHKEEIEEGTRLKQLLLEDGKIKGLKEEDVMKRYGKFLPTVHTPILNFLYFFMKESPEDEQRVLRKKYNKEFGRLEQEELLYENVQEPEEVVEFLYGNITLEMFNKIKKLKRLSQSSNEHEAFQAYRACIALCKKYELEFNKIPI